MKMKQKEKNRLVGIDVFVNGRPARIVGRLMEFPTIYIVDEPATDREYCWETVKLIVDQNNGQFNWATQ